jgi:hypothetical protein
MAALWLVYFNVMRLTKTKSDSISLSQSVAQMPLLSDVI